MLIINLTTTQRYKIKRFNIILIKDDFYKLVKDFPQLSNEYRNSTVADNDMKLIGEGESKYESKSFKWVFYFMTVGFTGLIFTKLLNPEFGTRWSSLGIIGSGFFFYGLMIKRKKKNN